MMTCREVSSIVAAGRMGQAPLPERARLWLHLAMCRHCRAFWKQVRALDAGMRAILRRLGEEAPEDLDRRVVERLLADGSRRLP